jgi:large subunit ribosomal protein L18
VRKKQTRYRRALRTRCKISELAVLRPSVHRTPRHIYAQVIAPDGGTVIAAASTVQEKLREGLKSPGNKTAAAVVGKAIADRAKAAGVTRVAFDRSGFRYHGRVKALADAARENGLQF